LGFLQGCRANDGVAGRWATGKEPQNAQDAGQSITGAGEQAEDSATGEVERDVEHRDQRRGNYYGLHDYSLERFRGQDNGWRPQASGAVYDDGPARKAAMASEVLSGRA